MKHVVFLWSILFPTLKEPEAYVTYVKGNEAFKMVQFTATWNFFSPRFASPPAEGAIISLLVLNISQASSLMFAAKNLSINQQST